MGWLQRIFEHIIFAIMQMRYKYWFLVFGHITFALMQIRIDVIWRMTVIFRYIIFALMQITIVGVINLFDVQMDI